MAQAFKKREVILRKIAQEFRPGAAVVEHFPFGRDSLAPELVSFLGSLKKSGCRIYSSVRDIIEQKVDIAVLRERLALFNGVLVHSDRAMGFRTSFRQSSELRDRVFFTGRVMADAPADLKDRQEMRARLDLKGRKLTVISAGGGIDGLPLVARLIGIKPLLERHCPVFFKITAGPGMSGAEYDQLTGMIRGRNDIVMSRFDPDHRHYVAAADLSVSMGGYNSVNDALMTGTRTVIVARSSDEEQKIRARYFRDHVTQAELSLSDAALSRRILRAMAGALKPYTSAMQGAEVTARFLEAACHVKEIKIRVSTRCNLACDMCSWKKKSQALPVGTIRRVIACGGLLGVARINLTGGEPTLFPGVAGLLTYIRHVGAKASLSTNGHIESRLLCRIMPLLDYVDISIDSDQAARHDRIRGRRGAFETTLATVTTLARHNIKPHINVTIRPDNYQGLHRMVPLLAGNIRSISFSLVDRTMNRSKKFLFSAGQIEEFYNDEVVRIFRVCQEHKVKVSVAPFFKELQNKEPAHVLARLLSDRKNYTRRLREIFSPDGTSCTLPNEEIRINADGAVSGCCFQDDAGIALGNVRRQDLCDIMVSDVYDTFRRGAAEGAGPCRCCKQSFSRDYGKARTHA